MKKNYSKLLKEYLELFTLIVKTVGREEKNKIYLKVDKLVTENHDLIKQLIKEETDFPLAISLIIGSCVVSNVHKESVWDSQQFNYLIEDFYQRHLKLGTNWFMTKNGLEKINNLNKYSIVCKKIEK